MIKTNKKEAELDTIIAKAEGKPNKRTGRPRSKVVKKACLFYLPENLALAVEHYSKGNKSFFAEEVFAAYFRENNLEY